MTSLEKYGSEWCRRRRVPNLHLIRMVQARELGNRKPGTHLFFGARQFYQCIHPSRHIEKIELGNLIIKRFSPDGRFLVCFLGNYELSVRDYKGVTSVYNRQPESVFEDMFPERFKLDLVAGLEDGTFLDRDFVFFTSDSRHLIVATVFPMHESVLALSDLYRNNESLRPVSTRPVDKIVIFSIDLKDGRICDRYHMTADRIPTSHGVHLIGRLLAVFSLQHQTIHFLRVKEKTGQFVIVKRLGRFMFDDDSSELEGGQNSCNQDPASEVVLSGLKQRVLTYLYHSCSEANQVDHFLNAFARFRSLRIWQMQLVTSEVILIRFVAQEAFPQAVATNSFPSLFILMNWQSGEILGAFDRYSKKFLKLLETFHEEFKNPHVLVNRFPCTIQHCRETLLIHQRLKSMLAQSRGSEREALSCIICQLPYPTTSVLTDTPYMDPSMFSYDDRLPSMIEKMKLAEDDIIRFFSRVTSLPLFAMHLSQGRFIQLLFHPTEPFAISTSRNPNRFATFHVPPFCGPDDPV